MTNKYNDPSKKLLEAKKIAEKSNNTTIFGGIEEVILRFFRWLSSIIDRLFNSQKNTIFLSLIIALICYISVNVTDQSFNTTLSSAKSLNNVNVVTRYNSESFEVSGLPSSCSVVLTGDAANVNNAANKNGYCLINLEGYTEGSHTVSLSTYGYGDNVNKVVTPSETQIVLKRKTTAQFDLDFDYINRNLLDTRYILSEPTFLNDQSKVNIRASQDTLDSISLVKALIDVAGKTGDFIVDAPLVAYNTKGQMVQAEIVPSTVQVSVKITSPSKTVPINLKVSGEVLTGYGLDSVTMDHQTTEIFASKEVLDKINEVTVNLDLSTISADADIMQPVSLPSGISASSVTMVNIKVVLGENVTKDIENVPIVYRNNDNNMGASEVEQTTVTVTATGTSRNVENISVEDCVAYINLKDSEGNYLEPGTYDLAVYVEKNTNAYVSFICEPNHINITLVGQE